MWPWVVNSILPILPRYLVLSMLPGRQLRGLNEAAVRAGLGLLAQWSCLEQLGCLGELVQD